jgi:hypothetical protein
MAMNAKTRINELEEKIAELKSERRGLRTSLTNLRNRTNGLLDYLEDYVEPKLQTKGLSQFRKQVRQVRRLL